MRRSKRSRPIRQQESTSADSGRQSAASSSKRQAPAKKNFVKTPRVGDVITIDEVELTGLVAQPAPSKPKYRRQTGTEEILEDFIVPDDVEVEDDSPRKSKPKPKAKPKTSKKAIIDEEDDDLIQSSSMIEKMVKHSIGPSKDQEPAETNGFTSIWETALKAPASSTRDRMVLPLALPTSVLPVPRAQPMHFLNKFTGMKLPLTLPHLRTVSTPKPMLFSNHEVNQHFKGTTACSKIAGNVLRDVIIKKESKEIFCMQIPNSLKTFTNQNCHEMYQSDIEVSKQNVMQPPDPEVNASIFAKNQPKVRQLPTTLALSGFSTDKPFGKLQLLKSGKVVLRIGSRVLDVTSTNVDEKNMIATLIDVSTMPKVKTTVSQGGDVSAPHVNNDRLEEASRSSGNQITVLGPATHTLVASYSYDRILETMPPVKTEPVSNPVEVDLTSNTPPPTTNVVPKENGKKVRKSTRIRNKKQSQQ
uniref:DNA-directed RNA polymerase III subunit RPC4 n=1 Tax=Panagrellus redivivus TaxID=6233 RepID=A0A7E4W645_PANRE